MPLLPQYEILIFHLLTNSHHFAVFLPLPLQLRHHHASNPKQASSNLLRE